MSYSYLTPLSGTPRHIHAKAALLDAYHRTGDPRYLHGYSDEQPAIPPAATGQDTYHSGDTVLGTAGAFWLEQIGAQFKGAALALTQGSGLMWLGVGVVVFLLMQKKGRR